MILRAILPFILLLGHQGHALVDYTPPAERSAAPAPNVIQRQAPRQARSSGPTSYSFRLGTQFDSLKVNTEERSDKFSFLRVNAQMLTSYDLFLDVSYWGSSSEAIPLLTGSSEVESKSFHHGNPKVLLGLNWIEFGQGPSAGGLDLYAGSSVRAPKSSDFGSSRNDMIVGVLTSKRFHAVALGLGYQVTLTGTPNKEEELAIGNIHRLTASVGFRPNPETQFILEGSTYRIGESEKADRMLNLREVESFSTITPSFLINIGPALSLRLGATFRTNRPSQSDSLLQARLFDMPGLFGNVLFFGLGMGI